MRFVDDKLSFEELEKSIRDKHVVDSGSMSVEISKSGTEIQDFRQALESNYSVLIRFTSANDKEITAGFGDYKVVCPVSEFVDKTNRALDRQYEAKVTSIDEESRIVYISCLDAVEDIERRKQSDADRLDELISKRLANGERVVYPAKLVRIISRESASFAILSILGTNVTGHVLAKDWAPNYIASLEGVCSVGKWYDIEIVSKRKNKYGVKYWSCSRVNIAEDPWVTQKFEEKFKEDELLTVKCVSIDKSGNWFWGVCDDVKGIQLFCDMRPKVNVYPGGTYKCYIKTINSAKRMFKVVPINEIVTDDEMKVIFRKGR